YPLRLGGVSKPAIGKPGALRRRTVQDRWGGTEFDYRVNEAAGEVDVDPAAARTYLSVNGQPRILKVTSVRPDGNVAYVESEDTNGRRVTIVINGWGQPLQEHSGQQSNYNADFVNNPFAEAWLPGVSVHKDGGLPVQLLENQLDPATGNVTTIIRHLLPAPDPRSGLPVYRVYRTSVAVRDSEGLLMSRTDQDSGRVTQYLNLTDEQRKTIAAHLGISPQEVEIPQTTAGPNGYEANYGWELGYGEDRRPALIIHAEATGQRVDTEWQMVHLPGAGDVRMRMTRMADEMGVTKFRYDSRRPSPYGLPTRVEFYVMLDGKPVLLRTSTLKSPYPDGRGTFTVEIRERSGRVSIGKWNALGELVMKRSGRTTEYYLDFAPTAAAAPDGAYRQPMTTVVVEDGVPVRLVERSPEDPTGRTSKVSELQGEKVLRTYQETRDIFGYLESRKEDNGFTTTYDPAEERRLSIRLGIEDVEVPVHAEGPDGVSIDYQVHEEPGAMIVDAYLAAGGNGVRASRTRVEVVSIGRGDSADVRLRRVEMTDALGRTQFFYDHFAPHGLPSKSVFSVWNPETQKWVPTTTVTLEVGSDGRIAPDRDGLFHLKGVEAIGQNWTGYANALGDVVRRESGARVEYNFDFRADPFAAPGLGGRKPWGSVVAEAGVPVEVREIQSIDPATGATTTRITDIQAPSLAAAANQFTTLRVRLETRDVYGFLLSQTDELTRLVTEYDVAAARNLV
ncbi:MAG: hypothetical protein JO102_06560, partial [Elusimicrobia bacterium]|nr:hypothetical protein [Elusimicrobiota bacterium]